MVKGAHKPNYHSTLSTYMRNSWSSRFQWAGLSHDSLRRFKLIFLYVVSLFLFQGIPNELVIVIVRYCCESKVQPCDLAFMLSDRCYLVKCYSEERCQALPARNSEHAFNQKMAFVAPWLYEKGKKTGNLFAKTLIMMNHKFIRTWFLCWLQ